MYRPGHYYHIYNRGCNRQKIFANHGNYIFLLERINKYLAHYPVTVIAYCLMPNHYHLLLRPESEDTLSPFIQRLFNSYTQAFNKQQNRTGTLFEGRARNRLVDSLEYVLHLCRYIHLNPVTAGLVSQPDEWIYSNYPEWVEKRDGILVDRQFIRQYFPTPADYREFVLDAIPHDLEQKLQPYYLE